MPPRASGQSAFGPGERFARLDCIPVGELVEAGVRLVLVDRDNTCVPRDTKVAPVAVRDWIRQVQEAGIRVCMLSNNFHTAEVEASAADLGMDVVHHAMKPFPFAVWAALAKEGVPAEQAVVVGDQLFTDVLAGSLAGVRTILVRPQSQVDLWYTNIFRLFEAPLNEGKIFRDG